MRIHECEPETGIEPVTCQNSTGLEGQSHEEMRRAREGLESNSTVAHRATKDFAFHEPETGIEPVTYALRVRRSTD